MVLPASLHLSRNGMAQWDCEFDFSCAKESYLEPKIQRCYKILLDHKIFIVHQMKSSTSGSLVSKEKVNVLAACNLCKFSLVKEISIVWKGSLYLKEQCVKSNWNGFLEEIGFERKETDRHSYKRSYF